MTINLHIVRNPVSNDSRVLKETQTLLHAGLTEEVRIAGFHEPGYAEEECIGDLIVHRAKLKTRGLPKDLASQSLKYAEWAWQILRRYGNLPIKVIHCHDLVPLPIAVRLKRLTGAKLVYDAHELETEMAASQGLRKTLATLVEQWTIQHVDSMITVSPSIKKWYAERYPLVPIHLVRNIPEAPDIAVTFQPLRELYGLKDDTLLFIYLGGFTRDRGIEIALDAFADQRVKHHILFMGKGALQSTIESASRRCSRIHWRTPVPPADVLSYASGADVGLCVYEDTCLNHRYCLPNKLFESLLSGLPVLASDLPDQAEIVRTFKGGWVVQNNVTAMVEFLEKLDPQEARMLRTDLPARVKELRWSNEAKVLTSLYQQLLG